MININEVYLLAHTMKFEDFEQELKSKLTGQPITVVIDCNPVVVNKKDIDILNDTIESLGCYGNDE